MGIGGKIGPVRAGISTRGIGGGVGPLSAGTGWKRGRRGGGGDGCGTLIAIGIVLALVVLAFEWPYLVTASMARSHHLTPHGQHTIAWVVEALYLLLLVLVAASFAIKTAAPALVGLVPLRIAFIVAASIHWSYDPKAAAERQAARDNVAAAVKAAKDQAAAESQARRDCTTSVKAPIIKARDLLNTLTRQYPRAITSNQESRSFDLGLAIEDEQTNVDYESLIYKQLDPWTNAMEDLNEGDRYRSGITPDLLPLLRTCGLNPS